MTGRCEKPALLEIGRIGKPHGVRGDVHVDLVTDRTERIDPGATVLVDVGDSVSMVVVERSRRHGERWVVHFRGLDTREDVEPLVNRVIRAEPIDDPDALWVHELIGSKVVDDTGRDCGVCVAVVDNPAHALLELSDGTLVPVPFVISCRDGVTTIAPPPGLLPDAPSDLRSGTDERQ